MAAKTNRKPRGRPFEKGNVANPKGRPKGSKNRPSTLPVNEAVAACELARQGHSESAIARMLNARPDAVRDALAGSRKLLELFAPEMARFWRVAAWKAAKHGDHKPAMAALQSIEVVKPIAQTYDTGNGKSTAVAAVQVSFHGFKLPGLPQPQQPEPVTVDVTASTT